MYKNRVVITGLASISGLGQDFDSFLSNISKKEKKQLSKNQKYLPFVKNNSFYSLKKKKDSTISNISKYAIYTTWQLLKDANIKENFDTDNTGVILSSIFVCINNLIQLFDNVLDENKPILNPLLFSSGTPNSVGGQVAIEFNLRGTNLTFTNDEVVGMNSIGIAYNLIKENMHNGLLLVGSYEEMSDTAMKIYSVNRTINRILCEGVAMVSLENRRNAIARKAKIYAEVKGYFSCTCHNSSDIKENVINNVIEQAEIKKEDIASIYYSGEGSVHEHNKEKDFLNDYFQSDISVIDPLGITYFFGSTTSSLLIALAANDVSKSQENKDKYVLVVSMGYDKSYSAMILKNITKEG